MQYARRIKVPQTAKALKMCLTCNLQTSVDWVIHTCVLVWTRWPPWSQAFENLVPSWWCCLGRLRGCTLTRSMSLAVDFEVCHWEWTLRYVTGSGLWGFKYHTPFPLHPPCSVCSWRCWLSVAAEKPCSSCCPTAGNELLFLWNWTVSPN